MIKKKPLTPKTIDAMLKAMLVFSRTTNHVLETQAVEAVAKMPLSPSKVQVLRLLGRRGAQTSTHVAHFLGVTKPAVTQIIASMVRAKLVTRRVAASDRREVNLTLTKKGRELFRAIHRQQRHYIRSALGRSLKGDTKRWIETLHMVSDSLARADQAFEHFCAQCGAHADGSCVLTGGDADCIFVRHDKQTAERAKRTASKC